MSRAKVRRVDARHHYSKEQLQGKRIKLRHIFGKEQPDDRLMKTLRTGAHWTYRDLLLGMLFGIRGRQSIKLY